MAYYREHALYDTGVIKLVEFEICVALFVDLVVKGGDVYKRQL